MTFILEILKGSVIRKKHTTYLPIKTAQRNCRNSRPKLFENQRQIARLLLSYILRFLFWLCSYNKRFALTDLLYRLFLLFICWFQFAYDMCIVMGCPNFNGTYSRNVTNTRKWEYTSYNASSLGSAGSYTLMLLCLQKLYKSNSDAVTPYSGLRDMSNTKVKVILVMVLVSIAYYWTYFALYVDLTIALHVTRGYSLPLYVVGITCEVAAQWLGIISLYAFSSSVCAIGTFAEDTFRRIKSLASDSIDDAIEIHEELRAIVSDTTGAYCGWFLVHWLIYGISVVLGFVVVALDKFGHDPISQRLFYTMFFVMNVFFFIFPCMCAAYVTSTCGSISQKINTTTSRDWNEGHIFRDRRILQMFVSYCSASPICFKIGRITFTSTLAWFSVFFGGTGLLFHFF